MKSILIALIFTTIAHSIPIQDDSETQIEAVNTYLYGEPNPEWLKYVNDEGFFDPSLVEPGNSVDFGLAEPFYDAFASVKFWLYTRAEPVRRQILLDSVESVKNSTFNPKLPIRFITHGWQNGERDDAIQLPKNAYLEKDDYNIIVIDWSRGANNINYYISRHRVDDVAAVVQRFIIFLVENFAVKTSQIQLIGHSLGAHIAGLTAKTLSVGRIPVIIGLDPALPLFSMKNVQNRLDISDADYVEVIHTNAGGLGFDQPIGTADFYPNYGSSQPGCGWDMTGACAHGRSFEFFAESILADNQSAFWSRQCGSYYEITKKNCVPTSFMSPMGGEPITLTKAKGVYHSVTNKARPYSQGFPI